MHYSLLISVSFCSLSLSLSLSLCVLFQVHSLRVLTEDENGESLAGAVQQEPVHHPLYPGCAAEQCMGTALTRLRHSSTQSKNGEVLL